MARTPEDPEAEKRRLVLEHRVAIKRARALITWYEQPEHRSEPHARTALMMTLQDETKRIDSLWNRIDDLFTTSNPAGATRVVNETKREIEAIEQKQLELTRTMPPEWPIVPINIVPEDLLYVSCMFAIASAETISDLNAELTTMSTTDPDRITHRAAMQSAAALLDGVAEFLNNYTIQGHRHTTTSREAARMAEAALARTKQIIGTNPRKPL